MTPDALTADHVPTLRVDGGWETILDEPARDALERDALPEFVRRQRWFGGKARGLRAVRVVDRWPVPCGHDHGFGVVVETTFADGGADWYFLPLVVGTSVTAQREVELDPAALVARVTGPAGDGVVFDATADAGFCTGLLAAVAENGETATGRGGVRAVRTAAFDRLRGDPDTPLPVRRGPATSSNSIAFFGDSLLLKLFRRMSRGTNPDVEISRFLTETDRFDRTPGLAGFVEYRTGDGEPFTLGLIEAAVPNRGDGWADATADLARFYNRAIEAGPLPDEPGVRPGVRGWAPADVPQAVRAAVGEYLQSAETLGRRTAEMHVALADDTDDPAFRPELLTPVDLTGIHAEIVAQARKALDVLAVVPSELPPETLTALQKLAAGDFAPADGPVPDAVKTRVHGDYHLGQVLRARDDFYIIDFEGEPTRTVADRRAKCSPVRDVAGMLRSFHYAAYAGLFAATERGPTPKVPLEPWAEAWYHAVAGAFLAAYRDTAADARFLPRDPAHFGRLLDGYTLAKALYELVYELNNRPDWVRIPLSGVTALLAPPLDPRR